jgi:cell division septum initiation protein DivIVA
MNENNDLLPNLLHEEFEMQMRGYSRRQVDDFVARRNNEIRELEQRLARSLDESEHLRRELSTVRQQALSGRPAHQEVSERIAQILKLADDEALAQKNKADEDIAKQRVEAQAESERVRTDAREQAERMLTAAQEQAERAITAARNEADKTRTAARTEADRLTSDTRKKADAALANAKAQAKRVLDEATARASAIHDGAERRLNLLSTRHAETVRRLTDILDGVQGLVAAEAARMSLEEEVAQSVTKAISMAEAAEHGPAEGNGDAAPDQDLALLAPPAPETVATGAAAPPRNGADAGPGMPARPSQAGRPTAPGTDPAADRQGQVPGGPGGPGGSGGPAGLSGMPPSAGRLPMGRPAGIQPPAPMPGAPMPGAPAQGAPTPGGPARMGSPSQEGAPRPPMPMPSGPPRPGPMPGASPSAPAHGDGLPADREGKRDTGGRGPFIDPEEPTEGLRMMP